MEAKKLKPETELRAKKFKPRIRIGSKKVKAGKQNWEETKRRLIGRESELG